MNYDLFFSIREISPRLLVPNIKKKWIELFYIFLPVYLLTCNGGAWKTLKKN